MKKDRQKGEMATVLTLVALGVITIGILVGRQLVDIGTRYLPKAAGVPTPTPTTSSLSCFSDRECGANAYCPYNQHPSYRFCRCRYNYANCDGSWSNGCEADLNNDNNNCGSCGKKCSYPYLQCVSGWCRSGVPTVTPTPSPIPPTPTLTLTPTPTLAPGECHSDLNCGSNAGCFGGVCRCIGPYGNCDNDWNNGCEVNLDYDNNNCGRCGITCFHPTLGQLQCVYGYCQPGIPTFTPAPTSTPRPTPTVTLTPTITPTSTPSQTCFRPCTSDGNCESNLKCISVGGRMLCRAPCCLNEASCDCSGYGGCYQPPRSEHPCDLSRCNGPLVDYTPPGSPGVHYCVNPECREEEDCVCPVPTQTPTPTPFHLGCVQKYGGTSWSCINVPGSSSDECVTDEDCISRLTPTPTPTPFPACSFWCQQRKYSSGICRQQPYLGNACGSGEIDIGQDDCSSGYRCCCSGVLPTSTPTLTPVVSPTAPYGRPTATPTTPYGRPTTTPTKPTPPYDEPTVPPTSPSCPRKGVGDANCDGKVDGIDYSIWLNSQCRPTGGQTCADTRADFNRDGNVDDSDYQIWFNNRGS